MKRPDFVTNEDIARWSDNIDKDISIPTFIKNITIIRETMYAGLWLAENLRKVKCPTEIITNIQFAAGELSFGNDCWQVVQDMLNDYINNKMEFEIDYNEEQPDEDRSQSN